jgi:hypothetical protein
LLQQGLSIESDEQLAESLQKTWDETKLSAKTSRNVSEAAEKMNGIAKLLHSLICMLDPKKRTLRLLPIVNSDPSSIIENTMEALQKIMEDKQAEKTTPQGVVSRAAKAIGTVCQKATPFIKVFLSVAVQGSAVSSEMYSFLILDTCPQSLWSVMQWTFYAYRGRLLLLPC